MLSFLALKIAPSAFSAYVALPLPLSSACRGDSYVQIELALLSGFEFWVAAYATMVCLKKEVKRCVFEALKEPFSQFESAFQALIEVFQHSFLHSSQH